MNSKLYNMHKDVYQKYFHFLVLEANCSMLLDF